MNKLLLAMATFLAICMASLGLPIAVRSLAGLVDEAPIILKAKVTRIDECADQDVFGFENALKQYAGGATKRAIVEIEFTVKGAIAGTNSVLFYNGPASSPFTDLQMDQSYILFVTQTERGLRLLDPANGGVRVMSGTNCPPGHNSREQVTHALELSLESSDCRTLLTAVLALGELGTREQVPAVRPLLSHENRDVATAALATCLRLGEEQFLERAVNLYEREVSEQYAGGRCEDIGFFSLNTLDDLREGISSTKSSNAVPVVVELLGTCREESTKVLLLRSIQSSAGEEAVPVLLDMAKQQNVDIAHSAYRALVRIKGCSSYVGKRAFTGEQRSRAIAELIEWSKTIPGDKDRKER